MVYVGVPHALLHHSPTSYSGIPCQGPTQDLEESLCVEKQDSWVDCYCCSLTGFEALLSNSCTIEYHIVPVNRSSNFVTFFQFFFVIARIVSTSRPGHHMSHCRDCWSRSEMVTVAGSMKSRRHRYAHQIFVSKLFCGVMAYGTRGFKLRGKGPINSTHLNPPIGIASCKELRKILKTETYSLTKERLCLHEYMPDNANVFKAARMGQIWSQSSVTLAAMEPKVSHFSGSGFLRWQERRKQE